MFRKALRAVGIVTPFVILVACEPPATTPSARLGPNFLVAPGSGVFRVQAATLGPDGQIVQQPASFTVCGSGITSIPGGGNLGWTKECDTRLVNGSGYQPYDGGSADVWYVAAGGSQTHLGFMRANYTYIDFTNIPSGATIRLVAAPESGSHFVNWSSEVTNYWTPEIQIAAFTGGANFLALLQKNSGGGGGGGDTTCNGFIC